MRILLNTFLVVMLLLAACSGSGSSETADNAAIKPDTAAFRLALLPTLDCLPLAIATRQTNDSAGLHMTYRIYASQMDAEEAVAVGEADACASDLLRTAWMQQQGKPLRFAFSTFREEALVANKQLRVQRVDQMSDRVIAIARNATDDMLSDYIATRIKKNQLILRPQINDLLLRQEMMENHQTDAALLPQPIAMASQQKGHTCIALPIKTYDGISGLAISARFLQQAKADEFLHQLLENYNRTTRRLASEQRLRLPADMVAAFHLEHVQDSIRPTTAFREATRPTEETIAMARKWLRERTIITNDNQTDTLCTNFN